MPTEAADMIAEAQETYKYDHAWLNAVIFNSQGPKDDKTPWTIEDFMPKEKEMTGEEIILAQQKELSKWHNWMNNCQKGA